MSVGRGQGDLNPLNFENFSKERLFFLDSSGIKQILPLLLPAWKTFGKFPWFSPRKKFFLPTSFLELL